LLVLMSALPTVPSALSTLAIEPSAGRDPEAREEVA
jgi:hypothetical protein